MIWRSTGLALLSSLLFVATAPPTDAWVFAPVAWLPLFVAIRGKSTSSAIALGLLHGLSTNGLAFYWLGPALIRIGTLSPSESVLGLLALCGLQGLRSAIVAGSLAWLRLRKWPTVLAAPIVVVAVEGTTPHVFPWSTGNLVQGNLAWMQLAEFAGCAGIACWLALVSALAAEALIVRGRLALSARWVAWAAGVSILITALGHWRLERVDDLVERVMHSPLRVGAVQGDIGPVAARQPDAVPTHRKLTLELLARQPDVDLVVWPETVVSSPVAEGALPRMHRDFLARDRRLGAQGPRIDVPLLAGVVLEEPATPYAPPISNAAVLFGPSGAVWGVYRKRALLPLTETAIFSGLESWVAPVTNFRGGPAGQHLEFQRHSLGVSICYEDTIAEVVRDSVVDGKAEFLVNLTSDTWFAGSAGPELHLMLAKFRSVENRRFLLQVSNDGVTALVDPAGRIVWALPQQQAAARTAEVAWLTGTTGYHGIGAWLVPSACVLVLGMLLWSSMTRLSRATTDDG